MTLEHTNFKKFEVHGGGGLHLSSSSWVAGGHYADVNDGDRWSGSGVEEPGYARDRGGMDQGVEDGRGVEAAARRLDRTRAGATGWPGREELREAPTAEEAMMWRSQPRRAVGGSGPLAGRLDRAEAGGR
jgi:hypothetical protein